MSTKLRYSIAPPVPEDFTNMTVNFSSGDSCCSDDRRDFYTHAEHIITCYVFGVLFFVGLTGNVMSFVVLQNDAFSHKGMRFLLSALAFVDTGLLLFGLLRQWLWELMSKDPRSVNDAVCKMWYFGVYFFGQLSPWTIVLLTLERLLSVHWPVRAKVLFNLKRIILSWCIMAACLFALNCHNIWKVSIKTIHNETVCMHTENWDDFHVYVWLWVDFFVVCGIPFLLIAGFNVSTIVQLSRTTTRRDSLLAAKQMRRRTTSIHLRSTTVMLVVVSAFFLLTTIPLELFFLVSDLENTIYNDFVYAICNFFYYLNSSANFGLYCLSGAVFRKALAATFLPTGSWSSGKRSSYNGYTLHRGSWMYTGNRGYSSAGSCRGAARKMSPGDTSCSSRRTSSIQGPEDRQIELLSYRKYESSIAIDGGRVSSGWEDRQLLDNGV